MPSRLNIVQKSKCNFFKFLKTMKNTFLAVTVTSAFALVSHAQNPLETMFSAAPLGNGDPTKVFTVFADGTGTTVAAGSTGLPTTGTLDGATGSFDWTWTAEFGGLDTANQASISSASLASDSVVTVVTAANHGFTTGDRIVIADLDFVTTNPNLQSATVTVVDATTFTYTVLGVNPDEVFLVAHQKSLAGAQSQSLGMWFHLQLNLVSLPLQRR